MIRIDRGQTQIYLQHFPSNQNIDKRGEQHVKPLQSSWSHLLKAHFIKLSHLQVYLFYNFSPLESIIVPRKKLVPVLGFFHGPWSCGPNQPVYKSTEVVMMENVTCEIVKERKNKLSSKIMVSALFQYIKTIICL